MPLNRFIVLATLRKRSVYLKFSEEISDFSFDFQHISGKHMFVSDFLSRFSSDNNYLTDSSLLNNTSYMTQLDAICKFNYNMGQGICTSHSFPLQGHMQNCRKLQFLVYLNQAQTGLVQLSRQAFFEIHPLCLLGKGQWPCRH